ncbi:MAG: hypothetical protein HRU20_15025 [Pseudomonadales bacterium]|nr:hypothetical protein [Pseudomonadales bacterium]
MEYQDKTRKFLAALKKEVKAKSIPYQQLADNLGVSIQTIKRQINAEDINMSKLMALCEAADIEVSDIWRQTIQERPQITRFTEAQDVAFSKNPHLHRYFHILFAKTLSPKEIENKYKISPASTHAYLRKLEKLGLIQLSLQGKVRILVSAPLGFMAPNTRTTNQGFKKGCYDLADRYFVPNKAPEMKIVKTLKLSPQLLGQINLDIYELFSKYGGISDRYFINSHQPAICLAACLLKPHHTLDETPITDITSNDLKKN